MDPDELAKTVTTVIDRVLYRHPAEISRTTGTGDLRPFDYARMAMMRAAMDAAEFLEENFRNAENLVNRDDLLRHACDAVRVDGDVLEFGVLGGESLALLCAAFADHVVYGFDSFNGLPEAWKYDTPAGSFDNQGQLPEGLPANSRIFAGLFADTIPRYRESADRRIALLHVDCDIYPSAQTVLFGLADRLCDGTVIVFDEFLNYPGWRKHEYRAFTEFVEEFQVSYEFISFASSYQSVAVRVLGDPMTVEKQKE
jgi:hypothetical protein